MVWLCVGLYAWVGFGFVRGLWRPGERPPVWVCLLMLPGWPGMLGYLLGVKAREVVEAEGGRGAVRGD